MAQTTTNPTEIIGKPLDRTDGRAKVTGQARYAAEARVDNLAHCIAFTSTIAKGRIADIDTSAAEASPGVLKVITHKNAPTLKDLVRGTKGVTGQAGQTHLPLQDDKVRYAGQYIGLVIAETLAQAQHAASLVKVKYADVERPVIDPRDAMPPVAAGGRDPSRGDAEGALASAPVKIEQTYTTPIEHHNPIEMHATVAAWDGDRLTLYDATQHIMGTRSVTAHIIGAPQDNVRAISPFLGAGYGCKGSIWPHVPLAAAAAKMVGRPVKFVVTRQQMFSQTGFRPKTIQKISLGADHDGKLAAIIHENVSQTSQFDNWTESSTRQTDYLYACPNVRTSQKLAKTDTNTPCQMRAPGIASGMAVLEAAMDELAYALKIDPLELRLRNYAETDQAESKPYSSKALRQCYQQAAERFGWSKRNPEPRSMKDGNVLIGWGMATATYPTHQGAAHVNIRLFPDGRALVTSATQDLGTGTYTIMTQIAADALGLAVEKVKFELGDSLFPTAPVSGGSQTAASVGNAILAAADEARSKLATMATQDPKSPFAQKLPDEIRFQGGRIFLKDDPSKGETLADLLGRNGNRPLDVTGDAKATTESQNYAKHAWGAQFCEVRVDEQLAQIRVSRWVAAFAAGRVLNEKTARSQVMGAIVMGIGMGLLEHTILDPNTGKVVTDNLADYLVPTNRDIPSIDCFFVEEPDPHVSPLGAKGVGELGIAGAPGAVANAVYHATGKRIRDYPITVEAILA